MLHRKKRAHARGVPEHKAAPSSTEQELHQAYERVDEDERHAKVGARLSVGRNAYEGQSGASDAGVSFV